MNANPIELVRPCPRALLRAALFDFDGTLSLVRSGWQRLMAELMVETLREAPMAHSPEHLEALARRAIDQRTGQPTIAQMAWLAAEVERRGGRPESPEHYKRRYLDRLSARVEARLERLRRGALAPDALLVPGARPLLEALHHDGALLALASGTDREAVLAEAAALGIDHYFGAYIEAPTPDGPAFSKRAVIARLLAEERLAGPELVAFGDGPVEIAETHAVGGRAVGVAFDEERGAGLDPHKRALLIEAGADLIVPDFSAYTQLLDYLKRG